MQTCNKGCNKLQLVIINRFLSWLAGSWIFQFLTVIINLKVPLVAKQSASAYSQALGQVQRCSMKTRLPGDLIEKKQELVVHCACTSTQQCLVLITGIHTTMFHPYYWPPHNKVILITGFHNAMSCPYHSRSYSNSFP